MLRVYFYSFTYALGGHKSTVTNPYFYKTEAEAYEYMGRALESLTLYHDIELLQAKVSFKYEKENEQWKKKQLECY